MITRQNIIPIILFTISAVYYFYMKHRELEMRERQNQTIKEYTISVKENSKIDSNLIDWIRKFEKDVDTLKQLGFLEYKH